MANGDIFSSLVAAAAGASIGGGGGGRSGLTTPRQRKDRMAVLSAAASDSFNADFLTERMGGDLNSAIQKASRLGANEYSQFYNLMLTEAAQAEQVAALGASIEPTLIAAGIPYDPNRLGDPIYLAKLQGLKAAHDVSVKQSSDSAGRLLTNIGNLQTGWASINQRQGFTDPRLIAQAREGLQQLTERVGKTQGLHDTDSQAVGYALNMAGLMLQGYEDGGKKGGLLMMFNQGSYANDQNGLTFKGAHPNDLALIAPTLLQADALFENQEFQGFFDDKVALDAVFSPKEQEILSDIRRAKGEDAALDLMSWLTDSKTDLTDDHVGFIRDFVQMAPGLGDMVAQNRAVTSSRRKADVLLNLAYPSFAAGPGGGAGPTGWDMADYVTPQGTFTPQLTEDLRLGLMNQIEDTGSHNIDFLRGNIDHLVESGGIDKVVANQLHKLLNEDYADTMLSRKWSLGADGTGPGIDEEATPQVINDARVIDALQKQTNEDGSPVIPNATALLSTDFSSEDRTEILEYLDATDWQGGLLVGQLLGIGPAVPRPRSIPKSVVRLARALNPELEAYAGDAFSGPLGPKAPAGEKGVFGSLIGRGVEGNANIRFTERAQRPEVMASNSLASGMRLFRAQLEETYGHRTNEVLNNWRHTGQLGFSRRDEIRRRVDWRELDRDVLQKQGEKLAEAMEDHKEDVTHLKDPQGRWLLGSRALRDSLDAREDELTNAASVLNAEVLLEQYQGTARSMFRGIHEAIAKGGRSAKEIIKDLAGKGGDMFALANTAEGLAMLGQLENHLATLGAGEGYSPGAISDLHERISDAFLLNIVPIMKPGMSATADDISNLRHVFKKWAGTTRNLTLKEEAPTVAALRKKHGLEQNSGETMTDAHLAFAADLNLMYGVDFTQPTELQLGRVYLSQMSDADIATIATSDIFQDMGYADLHGHEAVGPGVGGGADIPLPPTR